MIVSLWSISSPALYTADSPTSSKDGFTAFATSVSSNDHPGSPEELPAEAKRTVTVNCCALCSEYTVA